MSLVGIFHINLKPPNSLQIPYKIEPAMTIISSFRDRGTNLYKLQELKINFEDIISIGIRLENFDESL